MKKIDIERICVKPNCTIREAMQAISKGEIGVIFVVSDIDGSFMRVLTDGDIRRALLDGYGLQSSIEVIKDQTPIVATVDMPLEAIHALFSDKIRIVPVINNCKQVVDAYYYDRRKYLAVTNPLFDEREIELLNECIISGWVSSGGPFVHKFEEMMADYCNTKYAVSCSSATTGLHLALLAAAIGPGDEVIVPSLTFVATANAVTYVGAKPVFVDSQFDTWNINPSKIKEAISSKTKAIIPVHLYGHPADMDPINEVASEHDLIVIEDAAEAQGATYKGKRVGSLGDIAVFSFFGNKVITTGEGGMIVTDDKEIAEKCRILRDHGMSPDKKFWHIVIGYNYRMTNIQAALGIAQMMKVDNIISKKRAVAGKYEENLLNVPGIILPPNMAWAENIYWLYTVLFDEKLTGYNAEKIMFKLKEAGIDTRPVFPPLHTQPIYKNSQNLPVSEKLSAMGVSLPSAPDIKDEDIKKVCDIIKNNININ